MPSPIATQPAQVAQTPTLPIERADVTTPAPPLDLDNVVGGKKRESPEPQPEGTPEAKRLATESATATVGKVIAEMILPDGNPAPAHQAELAATNLNEGEGNSSIPKEQSENKHDDVHPDNEVEEAGNAPPVETAPTTQHGTTKASNQTEVSQTSPVDMKGPHDEAACPSKASASAEETPITTKLDSDTDHPASSNGKTISAEKPSEQGIKASLTNTGPENATDTAEKLDPVTCAPPADESQKTDAEKVSPPATTTPVTEESQKAGNVGSKEN